MLQHLKFLCATRIEFVDVLIADCRGGAAVWPLQVTARLLLDLREQLHPVQQPVKVSGKLSTRYNAAGSTAGHMWKVTLWSLYEAPAGESTVLVCGFVCCVWRAGLGLSRLMVCR